MLASIKDVKDLRGQISRMEKYDCDRRIFRGYNLVRAFHFGADADVAHLRSKLGVESSACPSIDDFDSEFFYTVIVPGNDRSTKVEGVVLFFLFPGGVDDYGTPYIECGTDKVSLRYILERLNRYGCPGLQGIPLQVKLLTRQAQGAGKATFTEQEKLDPRVEWSSISDFAGDGQPSAFIKEICDKYAKNKNTGSQQKGMELINWLYFLKKGLFRQQLQNNAQLPRPKCKARKCKFLYLNYF